LCFHGIWLKEANGKDRMAEPKFVVGFFGGAEGVKGNAM